MFSKRYPEFFLTLHQFIGARAQFAQQPSVLDRNHCLIGKGAGQLDLILGVALHVIARENYDADEHLPTKQRHA